jgi:hypothetical protein
MSSYHLSQDQMYSMSIVCRFGYDVEQEVKNSASPFDRINIKNETFLLFSYILSIFQIFFFSFVSWQPSRIEFEFNDEKFFQQNAAETQRAEAQCKFKKKNLHRGNENCCVNLFFSFIRLYNIFYVRERTFKFCWKYWR